MGGGDYYIFNVCRMQMSRCVSRAKIDVFFALHEYWTDFDQVITTTNRWTGYILGENIPGTSQQYTIENSNRRQIGTAT